MFIALDNVADYLRISETAALQPHIEMAEVLIAAYLGCETLEETSVSTKVRLMRPRMSIPVDTGPIANVSKITKVQVKGKSAMDSDDIKLPTYWSIGRWDQAFPEDTDITIEYTAGFSASTIPDRIKKAIIITAADLYNRPDRTIRSERIGDYSLTRSNRKDDEATVLPRIAVKLVQPWARPE